MPYISPKRTNTGSTLKKLFPGRTVRASVCKPFTFDLGQALSQGTALRTK